MLGQNDFIEYWAAFQLFLDNADLYKPALMAKVQQQQGFLAIPPLMMWLPPWALVLLYPLLCWEFDTAAQLWLIFNILLLICSALIISKLYQLPASQKPFLLAASLSFLPALSTIQLGQVSIFILFGLCLFLILIKQKLDILAGFSLVLLSLKPHLFFIFAIALLFWIIKEKRYRVIIGAVSASLLLLGLTVLLSADSLYYWWRSITTVAPGAPAKLSWITPTLSGILRLNFWPESTELSWRVFFVSAIGMLITLLMIFKRNLLKTFIPKHHC